MFDIVNDFVPTNIIVKLKLLNQRAYEVAWSVALLRGYENLDELVNDVFLDELVNDVFLDSIEIIPDGRDDFDNVKWGFKTREQGKRMSKDISIIEEDIVEMQKEIEMDLRVRITESQYEALKTVAEASGDTLDEYLHSCVIQGME